MSTPVLGVHQSRLAAMAATCAIATIGVMTPAVAGSAGPAAIGTPDAAGTSGAVPMQMVEPIDDDSIFISEFHYDNEGPDEDEFVEVQGPEGGGPRRVARRAL